MQTGSASVCTLKTSVIAPCVSTSMQTSHGQENVMSQSTKLKIVRELKPAEIHQVSGGMMRSDPYEPPIGGGGGGGGGVNVPQAGAVVGTLYGALFGLVSGGPAGLFIGAVAGGMAGGIAGTAISNAHP
jgi:hypothetical protein